jgi:uncharacterized membrane protein
MALPPLPGSPHGPPRSPIVRNPQTDEAKDHIAQNVETIAALRAHAEEGVGVHQRTVERFTASLGRPRTLYVIVLFVASWIAFNVLASRIGIRAFDPPPFTWLQGLIGVGALLMTTMVLTTQNRQTKHIEQRAHLDLQINLLAEQKAAKLIALVEELRRDMPTVRDRVDPVADAMQEAVDPRAVLTAMEETMESPPVPEPQKPGS